MKKETIKSGLIILLLCAVAYLGTTKPSKTTLGEEPVLQDTIFLNQWRREKAEKAQLVLQYQNTIQQLEARYKSLSAVAASNLVALNSSRQKAKFLLDEISEVIKNKVDTSLVAALPVLVDSLQSARLLETQYCDSTIQNLQYSIANRDSALLQFKHIEFNYRQLQSEQEFENHALSNQLNVALKEQKRISRHKRLLSIGLTFLTGVTTSLIIHQATK